MRWIFLLVLIMCVAACTQQESFEFHPSPTSYYEFVYEDALCEQECMREYLLFSHGLLFYKQVDDQATMTLGSIDSLLATDIIDHAKDSIGQVQSPGLDCDQCASYHLFYGDQEHTFSRAILAQEKPPYLNVLESRLTQAQQTQTLQETQFVHFIFHREDGIGIDYHFFPDGTVLYESFGLKNGELLSSAMYTMSPEDFTSIFAQIHENFYQAENSFDDCNKKQLEWGYVEIRDKDQYHEVFTCGKGGGGKVFNYLFSRIEVPS